MPLVVELLHSQVLSLYYHNSNHEYPGHAAALLLEELQVSCVGKRRKAERIFDPNKRSL